MKTSNGNGNGLPGQGARAAIYARKSNEQKGVHEDAKSVSLQIKRCRECASIHGWSIEDAHIYQDDAISGAEFERRPGFMALLDAIKQKPVPFDVLVISEQSRIGREMMETGYYFKKINEAGVTIFTYLDGRALAFDTPHQRLILQITNFATEMEREGASQRTHNKLLERAQRGDVATGRCFGYENVRQDGRVVRKILEVEAAVVRTIFDRFQHGEGVRAIAQWLNANAKPCPTRSTSWAASSVAEILRREAYRGTFTWNKTQRGDQWGKRKRSERAEDEIVTINKPELAIISEKIWQATLAMRARRAAAYMRAPNGQVHGRAFSGLNRKYMQSKMIQCGVCGGSMYARPRRKGEGRTKYACMAAYTHGTCTNHAGLPVHDADVAVLKSIESDLLNPAIIERAMKAAMQRLRSGSGTIEQKRADLEKQRAKVEAEKQKLVDAIAAGGKLDALVTGLKERDTRAAVLKAELEKLSEVKMWNEDEKTTRARMQKIVNEWLPMVQKHTGATRTALGKLLTGPIVWTPERVPDGKKGSTVYTFVAESRLDRVLRGTADPGLLRAVHPPVP
jgi:DNA invertase Pin-like site-specific DNA recombinase